MLVCVYPVYAKHIRSKAADKKGKGGVTHPARTSFSTSSKIWEEKLKKPLCTRPGIPMASVAVLFAQGNS